MTNVAAQLVETLRAKFGDRIVGANLESIDPWIEVSAGELLEICRFLERTRSGNSTC